METDLPGSITARKVGQKEHATELNHWILTDNLI